jgi:hypothetical protein
VAWTLVITSWNRAVDATTSRSNQASCSSEINTSPARSPRQSSTNTSTTPNRDTRQLPEPPGPRRIGSASRHARAPAVSCDCGICVCVGDGSPSVQLFSTLVVVPGRHDRGAGGGVAVRRHGGHLAPVRPVVFERGRAVRVDRVPELQEHVHGGRRHRLEAGERGVAVAQAARGADDEPAVGAVVGGRPEPADRRARVGVAVEREPVRRVGQQVGDVDHGDLVADR